MSAGIQTQEIAKRSYMIWEKKGRPHGQDLDHWLQAERELVEENGGAMMAKPKAASKPSTPRKRRTKKAETATN